MSNTLWFPYSQMKTMSTPLEVVSAQGVYLTLSDGRRVIDATSSWWCVIHGYRHPRLDQAVKNQLALMSHVMLGGLTHRPAQDLADKLVAMSPSSLSHVFFADSGSVGGEVAIKMAIQYWMNMGKPKKNKLVSFKKAYHGDTTGVMAISDPEESMHALFSPVLTPQFFLEAPAHGVLASRDDIQEEVRQWDRFLGAHAHEIAGLIIEPLMQAAGGFNFYSPAYLDALRASCDAHDVLLIFDEVATGFGRTGAVFATDFTTISPDIMILGKGLTGGYLGLSAVLTCERVYSAFYDDDPRKALMHGPTFMGNPLACAVALESIAILEEPHTLQRVQAIEQRLKDSLTGFCHPDIKSTRVLGATGVIEVHDAAAVEGVQEAALKQGVWLRPFDRYVYTMPPYTISDSELDRVLKAMTLRWL
mgnify:CR=1 FL=1